MPSVPASGRLFGAKSINGSFADGLAVSYLISLFDKETADLVALIDGNRVTGLRTAATSCGGHRGDRSEAPAAGGRHRLWIRGAIAYDRALARDPSSLRCAVFSPTQKNRESFAESFTRSLRRSGGCCRLGGARACGAPISCCAPRDRGMRRRLFGPSGSAANATVVSIGSTTPAQRELPAELIARAALVVVDGVEEVLHGSGDMIAARAAGIDVEARHGLTELGAARRALRRPRARHPDLQINRRRTAGHRRGGGPGRSARGSAASAPNCPSAL